MKLDRNINGTGRGKYGLIKTRRLAEIEAAGVAATKRMGDHYSHPEEDGIAIYLARDVHEAIKTLSAAGALDWGPAGTESEFFVIKLRDRYASSALRAYSEAANFLGDDIEYAREIRTLEQRSGQHSPFCKKPD